MGFFLTILIEKTTELLFLLVHGQRKLFKSPLLFHNLISLIFR